MRLCGFRFREERTGGRSGGGGGFVRSCLARSRMLEGGVQVLVCCFSLGDLAVHHPPRARRSIVSTPRRGASLHFCGVLRRSVFLISSRSCLATFGYHLPHRLAIVFSLPFKQPYLGKNMSHPSLSASLVFKSPVSSPCDPNSTRIRDRLSHAFLTAGDAIPRKPRTTKCAGGTGI